MTVSSLHEIRRHSETKYVNAIEKERSFLSLGRYADFLTVIGDFQTAEKYFILAMKEEPDHPKDTPYLNHSYAQIYGAYGLFLEQVKMDEKNAQKVYKTALEYHPNDALVLGNYAILLHRMNSEETEGAYDLALHSYPNQATVLCKYATWLQHYKKDLIQAESYYKQAAACEVQSPDVLGNYAIYLHSIAIDAKDEAELMYKRAIEQDTHHSNNLGNYGLFLAEVKKDYNQAEKYYKSSLKCNPDHVNSLYNYAVLLHHHLRKQDQAEECYEKALRLQPLHVFSLYNYAIFVEDVKKDFELAEKLFQKAIDLSPKDIDLCCDYASFLKKNKQDPTSALNYYKKANEMKPNCPSILFPIAHLNLKMDTEINSVLEIFCQLVQCDYNNVKELSALAEAIGDTFSPCRSIESVYSMAIEKMEDSSLAQISLGLYFELQVQNYQKAEIWYQSVLNKNPFHAVAVHSYVMFLLNVRRDRKLAISLLRQAITKKPHNTTPTFQTLRELLNSLTT